VAVGPAGARERGVARLRQWLASRSGLYLISGGIGLIAAWVAVGFIGQVTTGAQLERRVVAYRAEITAIAATNTAIARMVGYAASPAYAERVARETLGYAREGDVVLLPARLQQAATPTAATVAGPEPAPGDPGPVMRPRPNWQRWLDVLLLQS
jgi:hypothetical protein